MRAFKFRTLTDLDRVLGMIRSGDLWCAEWQKLNDPMEGLYYYEPGADPAEDQRIVNYIRQGKLGRFVCALSARYDKASLWAYYADDFRGVSIEYDLDGLQARGVVVDYVTYRSPDHIFDIHQERSSQEIANQILMSKINDWRHEEEIRILSSRSGNLRVPGGVQSVTLGHRMKPDVKEVMATYCAKRSVPVYVIEIDGLGISRVPFASYEEERQRRRRRR